MPVISADVDEMINRPLPWQHKFNIKVWNLVSVKFCFTVQRCFSVELCLDINQFWLENVRVNEALRAEMSQACSRRHPIRSLIILHSQFYLVGLQAGMMQIRAVKPLHSF